nr:hypothetical protein Iba_chr04cCG10220 [Ipomoea batatas]
MKFPTSQGWPTCPLGVFQVVKLAIGCAGSGLNEAEIVVFKKEENGIVSGGSRAAGTEYNDNNDVRADLLPIPLISMPQLPLPSLNHLNVLGGKDGSGATVIDDMTIGRGNTDLTRIMS